MLAPVRAALSLEEKSRRAEGWIPPERPGANHWVQVTYQICPKCLTILALNRCG